MLENATLKLEYSINRAIDTSMNFFREHIEAWHRTIGTLVYCALVWVACMRKARGLCHCNSHILKKYYLNLPIKCFLHTYAKYQIFIYCRTVNNVLLANSALCDTIDARKTQQNQPKSAASLRR